MFKTISVIYHFTESRFIKTLIHTFERVVMKQNKYAANLTTINSVKKKKAVDESQTELSGILPAFTNQTVFSEDTYHRIRDVATLIYRDPAPMTSSSIVQNVKGLVDYLDLENDNNYNMFKKNIADGYMPWLVYRFMYRLGDKELPLLPYKRMACI